MPFPIFTPPIGPSPGTSNRPKLSLIETEFGDGYTQASPAGLNHIRDVVSLRWDGVTEAQMREIEAFFRARGGHEPFWYQPYGFDALVRWTCKDWSTSASAPWKVAATLTQSFVPGP